MLKLRPFRESDAPVIAGWIRDEVSFRKWSADRYEKYPVTARDICGQYAGCECSDTLFPLTVEDESGIVGHMIMRFPGETRDEIRFGFIIVDDSRRGMGYGKRMLQQAVRYARDTFGVKRITLGVFENNLSAYHCYKAVGFEDVTSESPEYYSIMGQNWKCLELAMEL